MNLDILVDQAQNNGGKASMAVGPESSALSKNNFLPSPQTSPPLLPAPNYTLFDQHHPMVSCFQGTAPTDPIRELERANKFYKEAKEYKKNSEENERKNRMSQKQFLLRSTQINSIDNIILERNIPFSVPPSIITIASCLSDRTGLNPLGCLYAVLGSLSIATWGRITIKPSNAWSEPAVDMILQVSTAGTKKSSLTKHLREPFEHFCSQSNIMYDEQSRNAKEKKRLTQKTGGFNLQVQHPQG